MNTLLAALWSSTALCFHFVYPYFIYRSSIYPRTSLTHCCVAYARECATAHRRRYSWVPRQARTTPSWTTLRPCWPPSETSPLWCGRQRRFGLLGWGEGRERISPPSPFQLLSMRLENGNLVGTGVATGEGFRCPIARSAAYVYTHLLKCMRACTIAIRTRTRV